MSLRSAPGIRRAILVLLVMGCALHLRADTVLLETGFEPPAYVAGPLAGQAGWTNSQVPVVQSAVAKTGVNAVSVPATAPVFSNALHPISYQLAGNHETRLRIALDLRVTGNNATHWSPMIIYGTNGFVTQLALENGHVSLGLANSSVGNVPVGANEWNRFEVEVNHSTQTVSAWVNGILIGVGAVAQAPNTVNSFSFGLVEGRTSDTATFDNVLVRSTTNGDAPLTFTAFAGPQTGAGVHDGRGSDARFDWIGGIFVDGNDTVYVADSGNSTIRKIAPDGWVTTLAGIAGAPGSTDGPAGTALLYEPAQIGAFGGGVVYVDSVSHTVRRISASGLVTTIAGSPGNSGSADGAGSQARFNQPVGLAVAPSGDIYVADSGNNTIRKIAADGTTSTVAGSAGAFGTADGVGSTARLNRPTGLSVDSLGNLFIADTNNSIIRKMTPQGVVSTVAGTPGKSGYIEGPPGTARFRRPRGVVVDRNGTLFVSDTENLVIRTVSASGDVSTFAGLAGSRGAADGVGSAARFDMPWAIAIDSKGNLLIGDSRGSVRKVTPAREVTTVAGMIFPRIQVDGSSAAARFGEPCAMTLDSAGNLYVGDFFKVRKVTPDGTVSSLAGGAEYGSVDGTGESARLGSAGGLAVDAAGNVYMADFFFSTVRKITPAGVVTTFAGTPSVTGATDGPRTSALFNQLDGVAVAPTGEIYVADTGNFTIRRISASGIVTTFAGVAGQRGSSDGAGPNARFWQPMSVTVDRNGNLYVADGGTACTVRMIDPAGFVTTVAGTFNSCGLTDGPRATARLGLYIRGIDVDADGTLYVADRGNATIRKISPSGVVSSLATPLIGAVEGTGSMARLGNPCALQWDSNRRLLMTDTANSRILVARESLPDLASIDATSAPVGAQRTLSITNSTATSWEWAVTSRPADSRAELSSATSSTSTFTPDKPGLYRFTLRASRMGSMSITNVELIALHDRRRSVRR